MKIAIRVDASKQIGTGHVMRCLTLADKLRQKNAEVIFLCREHPGNLCNYISSEGFKLYRLPMPVQNKPFESKTEPDIASNIHSSWLGIPWEEDAADTVNALSEEKIGCVIIDHFAIDASWERWISKALAAKIAVIDGQRDRPHECDFLLDPNFSCNANELWKKLVPSYCQLFLGPQFAFLRSEFLNEKKSLRLRNVEIKRILIAFGGVDKNNATGMAVEAFKRINRPDIFCDVVVGLNNPNKSELQKACRSFPNLDFHLQTYGIAKLMAGADLSIGAGGTMTWERCYLGLPTIIIAIAENQDRMCRELDKKGAAVYLGKQREIRIRSIVDALNFALENPGFLRKISRQAEKIMGKSRISGIEMFCEAILHGNHN